MAVTALELCICLQKLQLGPNTGDVRGLRAGVGLSASWSDHQQWLLWRIVDVGLCLTGRGSS